MKNHLPFLHLGVVTTERYPSTGPLTTAEETTTKGGPTITDGNTTYTID